MDRRERYGDPQIALLAAFQGWQAGLWTMLPVVVETDLDPVERTVSLQPLIKARVQLQDASFQWVTLPLLVDCPVIFPSGGGVTLTFPIKKGDEGLALFSSRCIDSWWQSGGVQSQPQLRMHDLSDGFYLPGVSSVPKVIPAISTTTAQLRNDAGTTMIELDPAGAVHVATDGSVTVDAEGGVTVNAAGGATINAETTINGDVTINGSLQVSGDISNGGDILSAGEVTAHLLIPLSTHIHGFTKPSSNPTDVSGPPLP